MKRLICFLALINLATCKANGKEDIYRGSTPAHEIVRKFLDISLTDSIDFIRWKLEINDSGYKLECEYGIGKPNTSGFIDRKEVKKTGVIRQHENLLVLAGTTHSLALAQLNDNLLHIVDRQNNFLVGNGGFSFTLNNSHAKKQNVRYAGKIATGLTSKISLQGRTPCNDLTEMLDVQNDRGCIKLKWWFVLNVDSNSNQPAGYVIRGTSYRTQGTKQGNWSVQNKNGRTIYKIDLEKDKSLYLLPGDENVYFFSDDNGRLLVGNENFSYTLNRVIE